jgi:hypothetical protein
MISKSILDFTIRVQRPHPPSVIPAAANEDNHPRKQGIRDLITWLWTTRTILSFRWTERKKTHIALAFWSAVRDGTDNRLRHRLSRPLSSIMRLRAYLLQTVMLFVISVVRLFAQHMRIVDCRCLWCRSLEWCMLLWLVCAFWEVLHHCLSWP